MSEVKKTSSSYGFLWSKTHSGQAVSQWHYTAMQEVIPVKIVQGQIGIDVGSGCGYDTYLMATLHPDVRIISLDISSGVQETKQLTLALNNVYVIQASVIHIPFKDNTCDFAYSYGVLHHVTDPRSGISEIARVLKKHRPLFIYLYENHSEIFLKFLAIRIVCVLRNITTRMPHKILFFVCKISSPVVYMFFTIPAKLLRRLKARRSLIAKIPFNFGTTPFSLTGDLFDRFSAPIEQRFNDKKVWQLLKEGGFDNIHITKLKHAAGWVAWGYKK